MSLSKKQKIIRFLTPILLPFVRAYWKIFKPKSRGSKVIVEHNGKYLSVRNSYGYKRWNFPGGRIEKGESPEEAGIREVKEEIGIDLVDTKSVGTIVSTAEGKTDEIHILYGKSITDEILPDEFEIEETKWFSRENVPAFGPTAQKLWEKFISEYKL